MHKRNIITALLLVVLLTHPAKAFTFSDDLFSIDIPEGEKTYYYTQRGTNMTGTMLENAQKQDMLLLIGSYNEAGTLQYTFKVEEREGTSARVVADELSVELAGSYALAEPQSETISGQRGWSLSGESIQNSNYFVQIYVVEGEGIVVFTTMYQSEAKQSVDRLLRTVQWSDAFAGMERDPDAVWLPGVEAEKEAERESEIEKPASTPEPLEPSVLEPVDTVQSEKWLERAVHALEWNGGIILGGTGALLFAAVLFHLFHVRKKPAWKRAKGKKSRSYEPRHAR